ncbi:Sulfhydryl oxidase [Aphelenchoides bicaudatus]|nr:Sulfhydryl oxidase [Aphelenchoides bicaudatus]
MRKRSNDVYASTPLVNTNHIDKRPSSLIKLSHFSRALFIAVLICLQLSFCQADSTEKSLYTDKDHVLELNISNFDSSVYNQPRAFFVEFYASWCGHCIHYKPTFVKFATNLRAWSNTLQVTVINCAAEENSPLCRAHAIAAFPTLKYFKVGAKSKDDVELFHGDKYNLAEMTRSVAGLVHKDYEAHHPVGWPKLEPGPSSLTLSDLWTSAPASASVVALVVDKEPYGDGYATMINYHNNPHVHTIVVDASHQLATQFGGVAVPAVHIFKRENPHAPSFSSNEAFDFEKIQTEVDKLVEHLQVENQNQAAQPPVNAPVVTKKPSDWHQFEVQYLDLTSALSYMLTQEIPRREIIDGTHLKVLKDWIHVLRQYVPLSTPVRRLFYKLDEFVKPLNSLRADDWLAHVQSYQDELGHPLPKSASYLACRGSKPYLRGYTCGLWTLFHTVTVEAYKQNKHNPNYQPYNEVLEPLHQFIFNYLSCVECAKNFNKMALETLPAVKTPEDTALWLWRAHNRANKRLSGDASEDPHYPKQQFPPSSICPRCRSANGEFDEVEVLRFLTEYYSNIKTDQVRPEPGYKVNEYADGKLQNTAEKHLNPKFAGMAGKVDRLEETENRLNAERGRRPWGPNDQLPYMNENPQEGDRRTFGFIWLIIIAMLFTFAYVQYRRNRSRLWKRLYFDYKLFPWKQDSQSNLMKYVA